MWRKRLHTIIFEADTPAGLTFDVLLLVSIAVSILLVMLGSVPAYRASFPVLLERGEWFFTLLFSVEYILRLLSVKRPLKYAFSFFGIVDLVSVLPTYLGFFVDGTESLMIVRVMRLLRIFRVFKLAPYLIESHELVSALKRSQRKITVFLASVMALVTVMGAFMFVVEGPEHGFDSIPRGMYWAVVTITTVGYGDISPKTAPGQAIAAMVMIIGYAIIAVPTAIVTSEMTQSTPKPITTQSCPSCTAEGHDEDATFCKFCGAGLNH